MQPAVLFKILQRQFRFRNPSNLLRLPSDLHYTEEEFRSAEQYLHELQSRGIQYSHPEAADYPAAFLKMKEPPLFFEYIGAPLWSASEFISVVGSREMSTITEKWMKLHLQDFVTETGVGIVSGGARGVDQMAHTVAIKNGCPTIFVLPSGLQKMYPPSLETLKKDQSGPVCFLSEFEIHQELHKSHFYYRNRLIAALGIFTLVAQASLKSGSLLTVHHCLEIGRAVATVPAHPEMTGFEGNLRMMFDGAYQIQNACDLHAFWRAESGLIRL